VQRQLWQGRETSRHQSSRSGQPHAKKAGWRPGSLDARMRLVIPGGRLGNSFDAWLDRFDVFVAIFGVSS